MRIKINFVILLFLSLTAHFVVADDIVVRTALFVDRGCRGSGILRWAELLHLSPDVDLKLVDGADIRQGALEGCDLLVMPGGAGGPQYESLGDDGAERIRAFVAGGGSYFGTCCGTSIILNDNPWFAKRIKMIPFKGDGGGPRGGVVANVKFNRRGAQCLGIREGDWKIRFHNGPIVIPTEAVDKCNSVEVLATMNCEINQFGDATYPVFGAPAVIRARYGEGTMLALNCHPESRRDSHAIIVGGIMSLTGRKIRLSPPKQKVRGAERVAFLSSGEGASVKFYVMEYLKLNDDPAIDVMPVSDDALNAGDLPSFDRVIDRRKIR